MSTFTPQLRSITSAGTYFCPDEAEFLISSSLFLVFYFLKTVVRCNCVQISYTYRYSKML